MDAVQATILGVIIGALSGIVSNIVLIVNHRKELAEARERDQIAHTEAWRRDEAARLEARRRGEQQLLQKAVASLFAPVFKIQHEMDWIRWHADSHPSALTQDVVKDYHRAVHDQIPGLLGAIASVAGINLAVYNLLLPHVEELLVLEGKFANSLYALQQDDERENSLRRLTSYDTFFPYRDLPRAVSSALETAGNTE